MPPAPDAPVFPTPESPPGVPTTPDDGRPMA